MPRFLDLFVHEVRKKKEVIREIMDKTADALGNPNVEQIDRSSTRTVLVRRKIK